MVKLYNEKELLIMAGLVPFNRRKDIVTPGFEDFRNMLDDFFSDGWPFSFRRNFAADTFRLDVQEDKNEYIVEAELPGVQKSDINITLDEGKLTIAVVKDEKVEENEKNYIHRERRFSSMSRSIMLTDADNKGVKAKLEEGVLHISVPKKAKPDNTIVIDIE
jgi:HSP20 family protein